MPQVVVVGAGPVGLWLAIELHLQGIEVAVLETRADRDPRSRAVTMQPRIIDTFAMRGIAERFINAGIKMPTTHFGGVKTRLDLSAVDTWHQFVLAIPQSKTERLLNEYALSQGVEIRRGHRLVMLDDAGDEVELGVQSDDGQYSLSCSWLVGCDGAGSTVRDLAGFDFPGTSNEIHSYLADVLFETPPETSLAQSDMRGTMMIAPMEDGVWRVAGITADDIRRPKDAPMTMEMVRNALNRFFGRDFGAHSPVWISRFGNATRQASTYRKGRILLAGDAAHIFFPAGAQGINVGLQDAHNLSWKLAAQINGWAPAWLLDSYERERRAPTQAVMRNTQAQVAVFVPETNEQLALREFFSEALAFPQINKLWAERIAGYDVLYEASVEEPVHPQLGKMMPDLQFGQSLVPSLYPALHAGKFAFLDLTTNSSLSDAVTAWAGIATYYPVPGSISRPEWQDVSAALIRPDGHLAWISRRQADELLSTVESVMTYWCGTGNPAR
ncbi:FAD-dependent monooxygenase [Paraburkholderia sediminicola]|uniref:FAD-dependent monooxygenase n=1 Tax=Paraburkholderia sediminicola TaxID=458836 RepID=UPI0038BBF305